jgi:hypothetical protein
LLNSKKAQRLPTGFPRQPHIYDDVDTNFSTVGVIMMCISLHFARFVKQRKLDYIEMKTNDI